MRFINEVETTSLSTVTKGRRNQHRSSNPWSFVEDNELSAGNDSTLEFMDFPIHGGGSELSQNKDKIEEWKLEMAARKRNAAEEKAWDSNTTATRRSTFVKCSDDNEIAEWFGQAKRASNKAD
ncbi:hypothetical protein Nepgr_016996 [Nepenthes gracilis]|uniref:Uncharacterized protein n=1 Tax=Nepenthes gracilis TaxID=150966 RepID=A0AAD3SNL8_NEPGR|nr:hypothetical protein Nepgr_016996 [Nepenthes gracilis]